LRRARSITRPIIITEITTITTGITTETTRTTKEGTTTITTTIIIKESRHEWNISNKRRKKTAR
jgi:hypothetical protein